MRDFQPGDKVIRVYSDWGFAVKGKIYTVSYCGDVIIKLLEDPDTRRCYSKSGFKFFSDGEEHNTRLL